MPPLAYHNRRKTMVVLKMFVAVFMLGAVLGLVTSLVEFVWGLF